MESDISSLFPEGLLQKTHQYTEFRPLSRFVIMDTCFDTVISERGCYQSVGGEECLLSYLAVSSLLHVSMLWLQFSLYLWSPGKMLSALVVLKINIILLCRAISIGWGSPNRSWQCLGRKTTSSNPLLHFFLQAELCLPEARSFCVSLKYLESPYHSEEER